MENLMLHIKKTVTPSLLSLIRILILEGPTLEHSEKISIRTSDTDVMVLSICFSQEIEGLKELWVQFGVGKSKRSIPNHAIGSALGQKKSRALLFFHSFIGCDTMSSFFNHPKRSAFMTWNSYPEIMGIFRVFATMPSEVAEEQLRMIE